MIYFASDIHLGSGDRATQRDVEQRFVQWLDKIEPTAQVLFLVGDIFDFWFEYKRVVPKGFVRTLGRLAQMTDKGIRVVMLTGDNEKTARAIGKQAGVDEVIAGVLPDGKEAVIRKLQANGKVAMVGDGINDAPALTKADVGIAIGAGTDIAIDSADIVLVKSRLSDVPAAIRLSRATLRNIRENLFWAFIYNVIGIPLAAGAFVAFGLTLNPMFGAAAMSLSSFCVVTNALRLNLFKIYNAKQFRAKQKNIVLEKNKVMEKTFNVEGMMCSHCEAHVKKAVEALDGVESAVASHEKKTVVVTLRSDVSDEALKKVIEAEGYKVV